MSWCYIQQISRILEQNSEAKKSWKHLPQLLKGQQRTLSGDDSSSVFTFSDQKTMWNIYENDTQLSDRCQSLVLFGLPFQTTILSIQTRFQTDLWSLSEMGKLTLTDSQTCFTSSKCDHPKTLTVWCILPPKLLVSSVKFFCLFFWEVLARITLLKWFNYNFPLKRGSLSDSKLFFGN